MRRCLSIEASSPTLLATRPHRKGTENAIQHTQNTALPAGVSNHSKPRTLPPSSSAVKRRETRFARSGARDRAVEASL